MSDAAVATSAPEPRPRRKPVAIVKAQPITLAENIERVLIGGDLNALKPEERVSYYNAVCKSLGLNPLTKPFDYIALNGKLTLYAKRDCTDQLRRIHGVSILDLHCETTAGGIQVVGAKAQDRTGRTDFSTGAVSMLYPARTKDARGNWVDHPKAGKPFEGDDAANAIMKAETKAKRRVTLSICGLGLLDETEIETIPTTSAVRSGTAEAVAGHTPPKPTASAAPPQPKAEVTDKAPLGTGLVTASHMRKTVQGKEYLELVQEDQTLYCWDKVWWPTLLDAVSCHCTFTVEVRKKNGKDFVTIKHPLEMISPEGEVYEWETVDGKVVPVNDHQTPARNDFAGG